MQYIHDQCCCNHVGSFSRITTDKLIATENHMECFPQVESLPVVVRGVVVKAQLVMVQLVTGWFSNILVKQRFMKTSICFKDITLCLRRRQNRIETNIKVANDS